MADYTVTFVEAEGKENVEIRVFTDSTKQTQVSGSPVTTDASGEATIDLADGETHPWTAGLKGIGAAGEVDISGSDETVNFTADDFQLVYTAGSGGDTVDIDVLDVVSGEDITIDWGDGDTDTYSGDNNDITHTYAEGEYTITFLGTAHLEKLRFRFQNDVSGDITEGLQVLPDSMGILHLSGTDVSGDITEGLQVLPDSMGILHLYGTDVSGDITEGLQVLPDSMVRLYLYDTDVSGDITEGLQVLPDSMGVLRLSGTDVSGDITEGLQVLPDSMGVLHLHDTDVSANCQNWIIGPNIADFRIDEILDYSESLIEWAKQDLPEDVNCETDSQYDLGLPEERRQDIIDNFNWTITDGGDTGEYYTAQKRFFSTTSFVRS